MRRAPTHGCLGSPARGWPRTTLAIAVIASLSLAAPARAVTLTKVVEFADPVYVTGAPVDLERLFVV